MSFREVVHSDRTEETGVTRPASDFGFWLCLTSDFAVKIPLPATFDHKGSVNLRGIWLSKLDIQLRWQGAHDDLFGMMRCYMPY